MNDLRICRRGNKYAIQDWSNVRKQIGKKYLTQTAAKAALRKLIADVATETVVISDRHKVRDLYVKFHTQRSADADIGGDLTKESIRRYEAYWRLYLHNTLPDVYLDELKNKTVVNLIKALNEKHNLPYRTVWNIVSAFKTFVRWCIKEDIIATSPVLLFSWDDHKHLRPRDSGQIRKKETALISQEQCQDLIDNLLLNKDKDWLSSFKLMIVAALAFTGLRLSELIGVTYDKIDIGNQQIMIDGHYDFRQGFRVNKTKNNGSNRQIDIVDEFLPLLKWWMYLNRSHPSNYLFPATRGKGPLSEKKIRETCWKTYAENGLAVIKEFTMPSGGKYMKVISSPLKGAPTKTFRHFVATSLINAMEADPSLNKNNVRKALGHDLFSTTEEIYGKHHMTIPYAKKVKVRNAIGTAIGLKITN
ncbi:integrase [Candidatus Pelagibacter giovannonii]|uniref:Integrase n=1 Tax=Candidatus Pelagibacter giovannonii TaxID=2563896 RepID=A0A6H1Q5A8_9PROT|nr:tyrosine-type recombinase/integrase [Candidatus Pelagibacter giovannonii]QIZ21543.1 integrase [Candidatus Pelagibacter giovannonii]